MPWGRHRGICARVIGDRLGRLLTGPAAFLLAGVIDMLGFTARSVGARIRAWRSRPGD
jgi:hypothetical protein